MAYPIWDRPILWLGGRASNLQLLILRDLGIRRRKPGDGCVPIPTVQSSHAKQSRTEASRMSPFCPPHLIVLGFTMSQTQSPLPHRKRQRQTSGNPPLGMGERLFGLGMPLLVVPYCWHPPSFGRSKQTRKIACPQTAVSGKRDFIVLWNCWWQATSLHIPGLLSTVHTKALLTVYYKDLKISRVSL